MAIQQLSRSSTPCSSAEFFETRSNLFGIPRELLPGYSTEIDRPCFQNSKKLC
jgi:hypothetical protein